MTKSFVWISLFLIMAIMVSCGVSLTHAKTTSRSNGLGVIVEDINPNMSLIASIVGGKFVHDGDGRTATALVVHPKGMYALFDEMILFCGDESQRVTRDGSHFIPGDLAFIYRRQAARLIDGVPCFELRSVDSLVDKRLP